MYVYIVIVCSFYYNNNNNNYNCAKVYPEYNNNARIYTFLELTMRLSIQNKNSGD